MHFLVHRLLVQFILPSLPCQGTQKPDGFEGWFSQVIDKPDELLLFHDRVISVEKTKYLYLFHTVSFPFTLSFFSFLLDLQNYS